MLYLSLCSWLFLISIIFGVLLSRSAARDLFKVVFTINRICHQSSTKEIKRVWKSWTEHSCLYLGALFWDSPMHRDGFVPRNNCQTSFWPSREWTTRSVAISFISKIPVNSLKQAHQFGADLTHLTPDKHHCPLSFSSCATPDCLVNTCYILIFKCTPGSFDTVTPHCTGFPRERAVAGLGPSRLKMSSASHSGCMGQLLWRQWPKLTQEERATIT